MQQLKLSAHFTLAEFERSATATALGIDNSCPSQFVPTLQQLCKTILEPLRAYINLPENKMPSPAGEGRGEAPVIISSGYRCPLLNLKVGGVYASQHTVGEAADIRVPDMDTARQWFDWLQHNVDFDQLILETANGKDFWIHVSCRKCMKRNRHQVIAKLVEQ